MGICPDYQLIKELQVLIRVNGIKLVIMEQIWVVV